MNFSQKSFKLFHSRRAKSTRAFSLVELLVVMVIISILAAMLLPSLIKAQENARGLACANNLHQAAIGVQSYVDDHEQFFPGTIAGTAPYYSDMRSYLNISTNSASSPGAAGIHFCPSDNARRKKSEVYLCYCCDRSYAHNFYMRYDLDETFAGYAPALHMRRFSTIKGHSKYMYQADGFRIELTGLLFVSSQYPFTSTASQDYRLDFRHNDRCMVLHADWHIAPYQVYDLLATTNKYLY